MAERAQVAQKVGPFVFKRIDIYAANPYDRLGEVFGSGEQAMTNPLAKKVFALVGSEPKHQVKWLYEALSVLDAKANGLLRSNSLVMAIISAFLAYTHAGSPPVSVSRWVLSGFFIAFLLLTISSIICFFIVRMSWGFLSKVPAEVVTTEFGPEIDALASEANLRNHLFVTAWWLGVLGFGWTMLLALGGAIGALREMFSTGCIW